MNNDNHIIFRTGADNSDLEKDLKIATKEIERMEAELKKSSDAEVAAVKAKKEAYEQLQKARENLASAQTERDEVIESQAALNQSLDEAKAKVQSAQAAVDRYREAWKQAVRAGADPHGQEREALNSAYNQLDAMNQKYSEIRAQIDGMEPAIERANQSVQEQESAVQGAATAYNEAAVAAEEIAKQNKLAQGAIRCAKEHADGLARQITKANATSRRLSGSMSEVTKRIDKLGTRISKLASRVFVFSLITTALRSLRTWLGKVIQTNDGATSALARLKGALLTLAQPLVNVIIPAFTAFVNVLAEIVSAIAKVVSALFGTTASESAKAAENLYNEANAIEGVGKAAEGAAGQLAGFDEINQLAGDTASGSAGGIDQIFPDFSLLKDGVLLGWLDDITQKLQTFASSLRISFKDVFLDWDNLTGEQIAEKIIVGLSALAGGVAGFMIGGVPGAIVGTLAGCVLGLIFGSLLFDHDGALSQEEILSMIVTAAGALAGGIIGFAIGGPGGAAIGVLVGAGLGVILSKLVFNGDGTLNQEEVLSMIVVAAGALAGGIIGFVVGGPLGAAIGVTVGAGLGVLLSKLTFDGDGKVSPGEIFSGIANAIRVMTGGILGFGTGGGAGAVLGISVGSALNFSIEDFGFGSDGTLSIGTFLKSMVSSLADVVSGAIGFSVGGTSGGKIAMTVKAGLEFIIEKISTLFSGGNSRSSRGAGREISEEFEEIGEACAEGFDSGLNSGANETSTGWVTRIVEWVKDKLGIHSPSTVFSEIGTYIMQGLLNGITSMISSVVSAFSTLWSKIQDVFAHIAGWFKDKFSAAWQAVKDVFSSGGEIFDGIKDGILDGLKAVINALISGINKVISVPFNGINSALKLIKSVDILGIKPFSWINTISIPQIPALATGAVIPPNREFLAVLGDQTSGNNIEAPESLIRQIVREEAGGNNTALLQAILEAIKAGKVMMVDKRVLARIAAEGINDMTIAAGKPVLLI